MKIEVFEKDKANLQKKINALEQQLVENEMNQSKQIEGLQDKIR